MSAPMIRVNDELLDSLRLLKTVTDSSSYQQVVQELVHKELVKTHVYTTEGYLPVGAVVRMNGKDLVITDISCGKVTFNDNSYVINGSGCSYDLELVAMSLEVYQGGIVHE